MIRLLSTRQYWETDCISTGESLTGNMNRDAVSVEQNHLISVVFAFLSQEVKRSDLYWRGPKTPAHKSDASGNMRPPPKS